MFKLCQAQEAYDFV